MGNKYLCSVIIPTYKREESLCRTLESLLKQDFKQFEILIVDNAVSPSLEKKIENYKKESDITIRYIPEPRLGLHYGRNRGALESASEILLYTDDDTLFPENWVQNMVKSFSYSTKVAAVGGKVLPDFEDNSNQIGKEWFLKNAQGYLSLLDFSEKITVLPKDNLSIYGCNMALRKSVLQKIGGFNPELYGDIYLGDGETGTLKKIQEAGWDLLYNPEVMLYHVIPSYRLTVGYLKLRAWNQGASDSYTKYHSAIPSAWYLLLNLLEFISRLLLKYFQLYFSFIFRKDRFKLIQGISYHKSKINYVFRLFYDLNFRKLVLKNNWYEETV